MNRCSTDLLNYYFIYYFDVFYRGARLKASVAACFGLDDDNEIVSP